MECPEGFTAMGDIPVKGLDPPNFPNLKCFANEKLHKTSECELVSLQNDIDKSFVTLHRMDNNLFLASTQNGQTRKQKCRHKESGTKGETNEEKNKQEEKEKKKRGEEKEKRKREEEKEKREEEKEKSKRGEDDCSGHGDLGQSECDCFPGWTGPICALCDTGNVILGTWTPEICSVETGGVVSLRINVASYPNYTYSMDGGPQTTNSTFVNVPAGDHEFMAFGMNGECQIIASETQDYISVTIINHVIVNPSFSPIHFQCGEGQSVIVTINDDGSTGPFNFSLSGAAFSGNNTIVGIGPGQNTITIQDKYGCQQDVSVTGSSSYLYPTATYLPPKCHGSGQIQMNATAGSPPYTFSMSGYRNVSMDGLFTNVGTGIYTGYVTDSSGCTVSARIVAAGEPTMLQASALVQNPNCSNFTFSVNVSGGTGTKRLRYNGKTYTSDTGTFAWNMDGVPTLRNYTVTDANGCYINEDFDIPVTPHLTTYCNHTIPMCNGEGFNITIGVQNGSAPYTYSMDGNTFQPSNEFNIFLAGVKTVYVRDSEGCMASAPCTLYDIPALISGYNSQGACSEPTGFFNMTPSGGTPPYQFSLDGVVFQKNGTFDRKVPGLYPVTIKDSHNCTKIVSANVAAAGELFLAVTVHNLLFLNYSDTSNNSIIPASIDLVASRGKQPYTAYYLDNHISSVPTFLNVSFGEHNATVKDSNNCTYTVFGIPVTFATVNTGPFCGDNECQTSIQETCATCPEDCRPCNMSLPYLLPLPPSESINSLLVAWVPFPNASHSYIYQLLVKSNATGGSNIFFTPNEPFMVSGLLPGYTYVITITPQVSFGALTYVGVASIVTGTTAGTPNPPLITVQQHGRDYFLLSWKAPYNGLLPISNYTIELLKYPFAVGFSTPNTSIYLTNLEPNTTYTIFARTYNSYFPSNNTSVFNFTTDPGTKPTKQNQKINDKAKN
eukprot:Phypoly_transcript_00169.p1 GENE.Phypoly_transcript_00169~~Phypoly_transcript_00169.p1  ORF type:complete len:949 (+),score=116.32 Phypoly_transcript_00169:2113-4959(+)